jgi:hypothetical protein
VKSCPTCNRTFEDTFTFCLVDGSILSAPFDPATTQQYPTPRGTNDTPTEVLPASPTLRDQIAPTLPAAEVLTIPALPGVKTHAAPPEIVTEVSKPGTGSNIEPKDRGTIANLILKALQWIVGIVLMFLVGVIGAGMDSSKWGLIWATQGVLGGVVGGGAAVLIRRKLIGIPVAAVCGIAVGLIMVNNMRPQDGPGTDDKIRIGAFFFALGGWALTRFVGAKMTKRPTADSTT